MGELDEHIDRWRRRLAIAREDLADFEAGQRQYRDDVDITADLVERTKQDIELFTRLIAGFERQKARTE